MGIIVRRWLFMPVRFAIALPLTVLEVMFESNENALEMDLSSLWIDWVWRFK